MRVNHHRGEIETQPATTPKLKQETTTLPTPTGLPGGDQYRGGGQAKTIKSSKEPPAGKTVGVLSGPRLSRMIRRNVANQKYYEEPRLEGTVNKRGRKRAEKKNFRLADTQKPGRIPCQAVLGDPFLLKGGKKSYWKTGGVRRRKTRDYVGWGKKTGDGDRKTKGNGERNDDYIWWGRTPHKLGTSPESKP